MPSDVLADDDCGLYPVSGIALKGQNGKRIRAEFWAIAEKEFKNNKTACFKALIAEAVERRAKSKK